MSRRAAPPPARSKRPSPLVHVIVPLVAMVAMALMLGAAAWILTVGLVAGGSWQGLFPDHSPDEVVAYSALVAALFGLHIGALRSLRGRDRWRGLALIPVVLVDGAVGAVALTLVEVNPDSNLVAAIEADDVVAFERALEEHTAALTPERQAVFDLKNRPDLLMAAARSGSARVTRRFLREASEVRTCDAAAALEKAVEAGHLDVVKVLIDGGIDVNAACGACRNDPALYAAAWSGDVPIVLTLLDGGADPECVGDDQSTALMKAASLDHADVVAVLIDRGARLDAVNNVGETALVLAAETGSLASTELLLAAGAEVDGEADSRPPLFVAAAGGHLEVVQRLVEAGAELDRPVKGVGDQPERAVDLAHRRGHEAVVQALVEAGAEPPVGS